MKTNLSNLYKVVLTLYVTLSGLAVTAQQSPAKTKKDTSANKLATDMSISKTRAAQIKTVLNYKHEAIDKLMKDSSISPAEKHVRFKSMVMERHRKIDSVMTPSERLKMKQVYGEATQKESEHLAKVAQRQEAAMNKVPHKMVTKTIQKDSVKRNPKAN